MTLLSINVNKIATLRNSRGNDYPNVLQVAQDLIKFGAQGITVHPRPDERHIKKIDVYEISKNIHVEFNIEGYPSPEFVKMIQEVRPAQCTLVPDPPHVLTSNAGWDVHNKQAFLQEVIAEIKKAGVRTSIFMDPADRKNFSLEEIKSTGTDRIELYTEAYAKSFSTGNYKEVLESYSTFAKEVSYLGIGINAGHDLNLENLKTFVTEVPNVLEVSIGHALVCDSLYYGFKETIARYLDCLK